MKMIDDDPYLEISGAYRLKRLRQESVEQVRRELEAGEYDGIAFTPYGPDFRDQTPCWTRDVDDFLKSGLPAKAIFVSSADKIGFSLESLRYVDGLENLGFSDFSGAGTLNVPTLKILSVRLDDGIILGDLPALRNCNISNASSFHIESLSRVAPNLEELSIVDSRVTDICGIEGLTALSTLHLAYLRRLRSIAPAGKLKQLKKLDIESVRKITDLEETLSILPNLKEVVLDKTAPLNSWDWLGGHRIERLICFNMEFPSDLTPALKDIPHHDLARRIG